MSTNQQCQQNVQNINVFGDFFSFFFFGRLSIYPPIYEISSELFVFALFDQAKLHTVKPYRILCRRTSFFELFSERFPGHDFVVISAGPLSEHSLALFCRLKEVLLYRRSAFEVRATLVYDV